MQITDLALEEKIPPLWRLAFRPFFWFGSLFSIFAIVLWQLIYTGNLAFSPYGGGYWWHIHEMIFGFTMAIIAGFLLTAIQNWTGLRGVNGKVLFGLFTLWLIPRIVLLLPASIPQPLIIISDLAFLPAVIYYLTAPLIRIKQYRNLFFIPILLLFTLFNALFHYHVFAEQPFNISKLSHSAILLICLLISVMAGRVTPMFTANGTQTEKVTPIPLLEIITNGSLFLLTLALFFDAFIALPNATFIGLFFIAGISQLIRWLRWRPWLTITVPLLWSLHGAIKLLAIGLLLLSASYITPYLLPQHIWHMLTIGAIGAIILAMITRVSLGHTGQALKPPKLMSIGFALLPLAAIIRAIAPVILPEQTLLFIHASSGMWVLAFLIFALSYGPMLWRARVDGRPG